MKFLQALREAHEEDENAFPFTYCTQLFEEMSAVWCEEVREKRRGLCAKTRNRKSSVGGFEASGFGAWPQRAAKFPIPAGLGFGRSGRLVSEGCPSSPKQGYGALAQQAVHEHVTRERKPDHRKTAGPTETESSGVPPDESDKAGRAPRLALKTEVPKTGEGSQAYPAGKHNSPAEVKRAHAPQCQKTKKPICWDAACHIGCQRSSCPHAHEPLPSLSRLDYTVAMQVLRRGGLKNGPKVNPKDVDGRVAQLRAQAKEEQASKIEPARGKTKAKAKAKEKAGWSVPEDYQRPVTGPGDRTGGPRSRTGSRLASKFCQRYHALFHPRGRRRGGSGVLRPLDGCSDRLHSHAAARLVNHAVNGTQTDLSAILAQAVDYGHPQLAEEAQTYLESLGGKVEAQFEQMTWDGKTGRTRLLFHEPLGRCSTPARY